MYKGNEFLLLDTVAPASGHFFLLLVFDAACSVCSLPPFQSYSLLCLVFITFNDVCAIDFFSMVVSIPRNIFVAHGSVQMIINPFDACQVHEMTPTSNFLLLVPNGLRIFFLPFPCA